jgi:hypothetical protein
MHNATTLHACSLCGRDHAALPRSSQCSQPI